MDCHCDYEPASFYTEKHIRARKPHRCCECLGAIEPGQLHRLISGRWEGDFMKFRTCEDCLRVLKMVDCQCVPLGGLADEVYQLDYTGVEFADRWRERRERNELSIKESRTCQEHH